MHIVHIILWLIWILWLLWLSEAIIFFVAIFGNEALFPYILNAKSKCSFQVVSWCKLEFGASGKDIFLYQNGYNLFLINEDNLGDLDLLDDLYDLDLLDDLDFLDDFVLLCFLNMEDIILFIISIYYILNFKIIILNFKM